MVQKIDPYVVGRIVEAYQYSRSPTKVQSRLAEDNIHVSLSTIKRYAKEHREKTSGKVIQKKNRMEARTAISPHKGLRQQGS